MNRPAISASDTEPKPEQTPAEKLQDALTSLIEHGAGYSALIHANGVFIAESKRHPLPLAMREELSILGAALIAASHALSRCVKATATTEITQRHDLGVVLLTIVGHEQWLLLMADSDARLAPLRQHLGIIKPALLEMMDQSILPQNHGFMDDIEFADLANLTFD